LPLESRFTDYTYELRVDYPKGISGPLPVLIYLDGNLPTARPLYAEAQQLMQAGLMPPTLLVGIAHPKRPLIRRNRDFVLAKYESLFKESRKPSGAFRFHQCILNEVMPMVRNQFDVIEEWTLAGHSFGGLFVLYSMFQERRPFSRYLALSPGAWIHSREIIELALQLKWKYGSPTGTLYQVAGSFEKLNMVLDSMKAFSRRLELRDMKGLNFREEVLKGETHFSVVRPGVRAGLEFIYESYSQAAAYEL